MLWENNGEFGDSEFPKIVNFPIQMQYRIAGKKNFFV